MAKKNEKIETGHFFRKLSYDAFERVEYTRVERTPRKNTVVTYSVTEENEVYGGSLETFIADLRDAAEGLEGAYVNLVDVSSPYSDDNAQRIVVTGLRDATEEEIVLIEEARAEEQARQGEIAARREERLIEQLRRIRPDLIKEDKV